MIGLAVIIAGAFAIAGLVEYIPANALWGSAPNAGSWFFAQAQWWASMAVVAGCSWILAGIISDRD
jgi:hypothetical protein